MGRKIIDHDWEDIDVEDVEHCESIPSVKININENDMVGSFVELEKDDLIVLCKVLGVTGDDIDNGPKVQFAYI